jgi:hypothetical protein
MMPVWAKCRPTIAALVDPLLEPKTPVPEVLSPTTPLPEPLEP